MYFFRIFVWIFLSISINQSLAQENVLEVETTRISTNQELPKILYVVPWKDITDAQKTKQKLVLHDFFGELYEPLLPSEALSELEETSIATEDE